MYSRLEVELTSINPTTCLTRLQDDMLFTLLNQKAPANNLLKANFHYTLNSLDVNPLLGQQPTLKVFLTNTLIKIPSARGDLAYQVVSHERIPEELQKEFAGLDVLKISGTLTSTNGGRMRYTENPLYRISGSIDLHASPNQDTQQAYGKLLTEICETNGIRYFPQGQQSYELGALKHEVRRLFILTFPKPINCYIKNKAQFGFLPVEEPFAKGSYSVVSKALKKLVKRTNGLYMLEDAEYVVKQTKVIYSSIYNEFILSRRLSYLHTKLPIRTKKYIYRDGDNGPIVGEHVYYIERLMRGETLEEIIKRESESKSAELTTADRLNISCEALYEWQAMLDADVLSRDLKPKNMLVDGLSVKNIDLNGGKKAEKINDGMEENGTSLYVPLESFDKNGQRDEHSEVYSMGMTLSEFWGENLDGIKDLEQLKRYKREHKFYTLFSVDNKSKYPLNDAERDSLSKLFLKMTRPNQSERCKVQEAICKMEEVRLAYRLRRAPQSQREHLTFAHTAAFALRQQCRWRTFAHKGKPIKFDDMWSFMANVTATVRKLQDAPEVLQFFIDTFGVRAFRGVKTLTEFNVKIASIIEGYKNELHELAEAEKLAKTYLDEKYPASIRDIAKKTMDTVVYLQKKPAKAQLTVDGMVDLTARLAKKKLSILAPLEVDLMLALNQQEDVISSLKPKS